MGDPIHASVPWRRQHPVVFPGPGAPLAMRGSTPPVCLPRCAAWCCRGGAARASGLTQARLRAAAPEARLVRSLVLQRRDSARFCFSQSSLKRGWCAVFCVFAEWTGQLMFALMIGEIQVGPGPRPTPPSSCRAIVVVLVY